MLHPTFAVPALDLTGRKLELHVEYHIRVRERIGVVEWRGVGEPRIDCHKNILQCCTQSSKLK